MISRTAILDEPVGHVLASCNAKRYR